MGGHLVSQGQRSRVVPVIQHSLVIPWAKCEGLSYKGWRWVVCFSLHQLNASLQSQEIDFDLLVSASCHSSGMCA